MFCIVAELFDFVKMTYYLHFHAVGLFTLLELPEVASDVTCDTTVAYMMNMSVQYSDDLCQTIVSLIIFVPTTTDYLITGFGTLDNML